MTHCWSYLGTASCHTLQPSHLDPHFPPVPHFMCTGHSSRVCMPRASFNCSSCWKRSNGRRWRCPRACRPSRTAFWPGVCRDKSVTFLLNAWFQAQIPQSLHKTNRVPSPDLQQAVGAGRGRADARRGACVQQQHDSGVQATTGRAVVSPDHVFCIMCSEAHGRDATWCRGVGKEPG